MRDNKEDRSSKADPVHNPAAPTGAATPAANQTRPSETEEDGEPLRPVSADMQQFIGRQLRAVFDDVAKQPIPDRFLELMKQLDGKTSAI